MSFLLGETTAVDDLDGYLKEQPLSTKMDLNGGKIIKTCSLLLLS